MDCSLSVQGFDQSAYIYDDLVIHTPLFLGLRRAVKDARFLELIGV